MRDTTDRQSISKRQAHIQLGGIILENCFSKNLV
jgi:hypothetical protein